MSTNNVRGFNELAARLNSMSTKFQNEVKGIVEFNAGQIERQAIADAPGPGDRIKVEGGSIRQEQIADKRRGSFTPISQAIGYSIDPTGYKATIFVERSAGEISVYIEMGTGQSARTYLATVPPEWKALAQKFYIDGKGRILNSPYLLPAYMRYQIQMQKELKQAMKNLKI